MKKLIRLTESDLNRIVKSVVSRVISEGRLNEKVDTELLSKVEYMDNRSVRSIIEKMIPASNRGMNTAEYKPIRQLVNFFDPEVGIARHGSRQDRLIASYILGDGTFLGKKNKYPIKRQYIDLYKEDDALKTAIYGTFKKETRRGVINTKLQGTDLINEVSSHIKNILEIVQIMIAKINNSEAMKIFSDTQGIKGSESGKIKGLSEIITDANANLYTIKGVIEKMDQQSHKGYDPLSYNPSGRRW